MPSDNVKERGVLAFFHVYYFFGTPWKHCLSPVAITGHGIGIPANPTYSSNKRKNLG